MTLCPLFEASLTYPHHTAIDDGFEKISYESLNKLINYAECQLKDLSEKKIALLAKSHVSTYICIIALLRLGYPFLLLHPKSTTYADFTILDPEKLRLEKTQSTSKFIDLSKKAFYFLSSGSSGKPKLIAHSPNNILESAKSTVQHYSIEESSTYLCQLPINHVGGFMIFFRMILTGGSILLKNSRSYEYCSLVPTQLYRLLNDPSQDLSFYKGCKKILIGGSPLAEPCLLKAIQNDLALSLTYGLSELASQVTAGLHNLGHPLKGKLIKINQDSEILLKGNSLFLGYGLDPLMPALEDGYFKTNDLGIYDEEMGLKFIGRKDRMFTKGGENIYPEALESIIYSIKHVLLCCVVDISNHEYGSLIGCFIDPYSNELNDEINRGIQERLGSFFKISYFFKMPETTGLKPSFKQLKVLANEKINP